MTISPTTIGGKFYIPYDLSDAWRELDRMLPSNYKNSTKKKFDINCKSTNNKLFETHWGLLLFLQENWIEPKDSRLLSFFNSYFQLSEVESSAPSNQSLLAGMILCGYYLKEKQGEYPEISSLTIKFGSEIKKIKR